MVTRMSPQDPYYPSDNKPTDGPGNPGPEDGENTQRVAVNRSSARVPEQVAAGVFSTGVIVMSGPNEFVLDFVHSLSRPARVVARVVLTPQVVGQFAGALEKNLAMFSDRFGKPATLPKPPTNQARRPSIEETYESLRLPDEMLSGSYANAVLISHGPAEFCFDFVTSLFPRSAVASRVYLSAPHVPPMLDTLKQNYQRYVDRVKQPSGEAENDGKESSAIDSTEGDREPPRSAGPLPDAPNAPDDEVHGGDSELDDAPQDDALGEDGDGDSTPRA